MNHRPLYECLELHLICKSAIVNYATSWQSYLIFLDSFLSDRLKQCHLLPGLGSHCLSAQNFLHDHFCLSYWGSKFLHLWRMEIIEAYGPWPFRLGLYAHHVISWSTFWYSWRLKCWYPPHDLHTTGNQIMADVFLISL